MSLVLHRSNRIEALSLELAELLEPPTQLSRIDLSADALLRPETIVVSSRGMQRWLSGQLAHHLGISSNINFPFPTRTVHEILGFFTAPSEEGHLHAWLPQNLAWRILSNIQENLEGSAFVPLKGYLSEELASNKGTTRNQYLLARRIADVFDKYLTYRPEMILQWEDSPESFQDDWQPILWNQLRTNIEVPHIANMASHFLSQPIDTLNLPANLPPRLFLFGLSTLPPLWVDVLNRLSHYIPVHLFLLCPSRQYWGHISSKREITRQLRTHPNQNMNAADLYLEEGHPLLSSFGRVGRDFQCVLEGPTTQERYIDSGKDLFVEPDAQKRTMLTLLQRDILDLRAPNNNSLSEDDFTCPPHQISANDKSIEFHSCHGPLRQVEVLRDRILTLLNNDESLEPREILVLSTDIETYAPLISAVFSEGAPPTLGKTDPQDPSGFPRLPFSVADRSLEKLNPIADCLLGLVELAKGRSTASQVVGFLAHAPIRNKFAIDFSDLPRIRQWVTDAAIRWGIDGSHRERQGHPNASPSTFEFGLDRLVLGYIFEGTALYGDTLSSSIVGESDADLLGAFIGYCTKLFSSLESLQIPKTVSQWCTTFRQVLEDLTQTDTGDEWLTQQVLEAIDCLAQAAGKGDNERLLELDAIAIALSEHFQGTPEFTSFLSGGITCCAMIPMRTVPFRVVCFLGMDDAQFPRQTKSLSFDLASNQPRLGDRDPRNDDRYLFLESLLSAREHVIICYTGRGIRDNKPYPPAVPVGELQDCIDRSFVDAEAPDTSILNRIVHEHPLQGFSPSAFTSSTPSFHRGYFNGAQQLLGSKESVPFFLQKMLEMPPQKPENLIALDDLITFIQNPSAAFLKTSLGLSYFDDTVGLNDSTPITLEGLERWKIGDLLCRMSSESPGQFAPKDVLYGTGHIPAGILGAVELGKVYSKAAPLIRASRSMLTSPPTWVDITLRIDETTLLFGRINQLFDNRLVQVHYGKMKGAYLLRAWLNHLALQAQATPFGATTLFARNNTSSEEPTCFRFSPLSPGRPAEILKALVQLYRIGIKHPLPLFAQSSWAFAGAVAPKPNDPKAEIKGRKAAASSWYKINKTLGYIEGDAANAAINRIYQGHQPYSPEFTHPAIPNDESLQFDALALALWEPLLNHLSIEAIP